jgi:NTE family protein
MIRPRLAGVAAMDYHRADTAIVEGERAVERAMPQLEELLGVRAPPDAPIKGP